MENKFRAKEQDCLGTLRGDCANCSRYLECLEKSTHSDLKRGF